MIRSLFLAGVNKETNQTTLLEFCVCFCQISSGASAMQIFDSWVGCLCPEDYKEFVLPYMKKITSSIKEYTSVPIILFGVQTQHLFNLIKEAGSHVIGVDWRSDIHNVWKNELKLCELYQYYGGSSVSLSLLPKSNKFNNDFFGIEKIINNRVNVIGDIELLNIYRMCI